MFGKTYWRLVIYQWIYFTNHLFLEMATNLSHLSYNIKVFKRVARSQITDFLETTNLLNPNEHSLNKGNIHDIIRAWERAPTLVIYLDFSKALDRINRNILLRKLSNINITWTLLQWIKCFQSKGVQCIVVDGVKSSPAKVHSGVPTGTLLGRLLFITYINAITDTLTYSDMIFTEESEFKKVIKGVGDRSVLQYNQWAKNKNIFLKRTNWNLSTLEKRILWNSLKHFPRLQLFMHPKTYVTWE